MNCIELKKNPLKSDNTSNNNFHYNDYNNSPVMQPIFSPSSSSSTKTSPTSPFIQINYSNNDNNEKLNIFDQTMLDYLICYENSKSYLLQVIHVFMSKRIVNATIF